MPEWLNVADDEAVELISGVRGRSNRDYIPLDDLDEEGQGPRPPKPPLFDRKALNKLIYLPFTLAAALVLIVGYSFGRHPPSWTTISNGTTEYFPTTILISLDGMHPHYISSDRTPYLDLMVKRAAAVPYMIPSFPTQTFPNHWTLVTGLYPGNHGIVANNFYDPELGEFHHSEYEHLSQEFWGGEPIWSTARRQNRISAVHMWPGSDFADSANYVDKFNQSEPLDAKADRIMQWIDMPIETRPQLILSYVPNIDTVGHETGISSTELLESLKNIDNFIAHLDQGLARRNLGDIVNLIIVSDHGMAPTSDDRLLFLDEYIDYDTVERQTAWPNAGIRLKDEFATTQVRLNLTRSVPKTQATVFQSDSFPENWHFGQNMPYGKRIAPIYIVPQVGWSILKHSEYNGTYPLKGVHGYAAENPLMRALFLGIGPKFNRGKFEPFPNVNLYPLLCKLLSIKPAKTDGVAKFEQFNATNYSENYPGTPYGVDYFDNSTFSNF